MRILLIVLFVVGVFAGFLISMVPEPTLVIDARGQDVGIYREAEFLRLVQPIYIPGYVDPMAKVDQNTCPHRYVRSTCIMWYGDKDPNTRTCMQCGKVLNP